MLNRALNSAMSGLLRWRLTPYLAYPARKTAFVLIDAQPPFLSDAPEVAARIEQAVAFARRRGMRVIHATFGGARPGRALAPGVEWMFDRLAATEDPAREPAAIEPGDIVFPTRSTLSAFIDPDAIARLGSLGVERVVLAGPLIDLSIDSSARDAAERDVHTTVLADCCAAPSAAAHAAAAEVTLPRMAHAVLSFDDWRRLVERGGP